MPLVRGQTLHNNRYRIVTLIGQGGMGVIYRAWDTNLNFSVSLKELIPQPNLDPKVIDKLRQQFRQEAEVLAKLSHSHLVNVTNFFEENGKAYLVMRYVEGESLKARIDREGVQSETNVVFWTKQLLDALVYCHKHNVLHRDIKPANLIIQPDGQAILVDFGLVKLWDPNNPNTQTVMQGMGTPEYSPPEQYTGQTGNTNPRSDLYSLSATMYHALTGQAPPTATDRIANPDVMSPIRRIIPRVSRNTERVILKGMALNQKERYPNAETMRAAFHTSISRHWIRIIFVGVLFVILTVWLVIGNAQGSFIAIETSTPTSTDTPTNTPTSTNTPTITHTSTGTPTNTSTPTSTPTMTHTPTPQLLFFFQEEFDDTSLSTNWYASGPPVTFKDGIATFSSQSNTFPLLVTSFDPFPGNAPFTLEMRFRYASVSGAGTGLAISTTDPRNDSIPDVQFKLLGIWQDSSHALRLYSNGGPPIHETKFNDTEWHIIKIVSQGEKWDLHFDEEFIDSLSLAGKKPTNIWIGNNTLLEQARNNWTSLEIDYIRIYPQ